MSATPSGILLIVNSVVSETKLDTRDTGKLKISIKKRPGDPNTYDDVTVITPTLTPKREVPLVPPYSGDDNYLFHPTTPLDLTDTQLEELNLGNPVELIFDLRTSADIASSDHMLAGKYFVNLIMNISSHVPTDTSISGGGIISTATFEIHEPDEE